MYERFTDRARKVMQLANQGALRFNHEYIGTEHILVGLLKEGSGVAAAVLTNLNVSLQAIRDVIESIVVPGREPVMMGRLPHSPRARKAIDFSIEEARNLNHNYVGTEHMLLGLIREEEGVAAQVLTNCGVKLDAVREEVLKLLGHKMPGPNEATETATATVHSPSTAPPPLAGLPQADVFDLIRAERAYQDAKWANNPHPLGEWLLLIDGKVGEAITDWRSSKKDTDVLAKVTYIAAVAVACLEQLGGPLVTEAIRNMEFMKTNCGYVTPSPRAKCWWDALEVIQERRADVAEMERALGRSGGSV